MSYNSNTVLDDAGFEELVFTSTLWIAIMTYPKILATVHMIMTVIIKTQSIVALNTNLVFFNQIATQTVIGTYNQTSKGAYI